MAKKNKNNELLVSLQPFDMVQYYDGMDISDYVLYPMSEIIRRNPSYTFDNMYLTDSSSSHIALDDDIMWYNPFTNTMLVGSLPSRVNNIAPDVYTPKLNTGNTRPLYLYRHEAPREKHWYDKLPLVDLNFGFNKDYYNSSGARNYYKNLREAENNGNFFTRPMMIGNGGSTNTSIFSKDYYNSDALKKYYKDQYAFEENNPGTIARLGKKYLGIDLSHNPFVRDADTVLHYFTTPSLRVGLQRHRVPGESWVEGFMRGKDWEPNSGIVSPEFAAEHPYMAAAINGTFDAPIWALTGGGGAAATVNSLKTIPALYMAGTYLANLGYGDEVEAASVLLPFLHVGGRGSAKSSTKFAPDIVRANAAPKGEVVRPNVLAARVRLGGLTMVDESGSIIFDKTGNSILSNLDVFTYDRAGNRYYEGLRVYTEPEYREVSEKLRNKPAENQNIREPKPVYNEKGEHIGWEVEFSDEPLSSDIYPETPELSDEPLSSDIYPETPEIIDENIDITPEEYAELSRNTDEGWSIFDEPDKGGDVSDTPEDKVVNPNSPRTSIEERAASKRFEKKLRTKEVTRDMLLKAKENILGWNILKGFNFAGKLNKQIRAYNEVLANLTGDIQGKQRLIDKVEVKDGKVKKKQHESKTDYEKRVKDYEELKTSQEENQRYFERLFGESYDPRFPYDMEIEPLSRNRVLAAQAADHAKVWGPIGSAGLASYLLHEAYREKTPEELLELARKKALMAPVNAQIKVIEKQANADADQILKNYLDSIYKAEHPETGGTDIKLGGSNDLVEEPGSPQSSEQQEVDKTEKKEKKNKLQKTQQKTQQETQQREYSNEELNKIAESYY